MKKCLFFVMLVLNFSQAVASENYNKMNDLVRQYMSTVQGAPHDLSEYGSKVIFSREDVYGQPEEILQLSDAGFTLFSALTSEEKAKLPRILIATPGSYAMKFSSALGRHKIITAVQPTIEDLDRSCNEK